jgi:hypothetical protein
MQTSFMVGAYWLKPSVAARAVAHASLALNRHALVLQLRNIAVDGAQGGGKS